MEQPQPIAPAAAPSGVNPPLEVTPPAAPAAAPAPPRDPNAPKPKQISIKPAIGDKPGYIWVANEDGVGGLGRVYMVKMRFGREVERIRMTKLYKKHSAKQVRDELDPLIGDLLYNEREHGALTEQAVRDVIAKVARKLAGPPRRPGPGGPGRGGPRGGGHSGPPRGPRPDGPPRDHSPAPPIPGAPAPAPGAAPQPPRDPNAPRVKPPPFDRPGGQPPRPPGQGDRGPLGPGVSRKYPGSSLNPMRSPKPSPNQPPPYEP